MLSTSAKQAGLPRPALGGVGAASDTLHLFYTWAKQKTLHQERCRAFRLG